MKFELEFIAFFMKRSSKENANNLHIPSFIVDHAKSISSELTEFHRN